MVKRVIGCELVCLFLIRNCFRGSPYRAGGACVEVAVLLGYLGPAREDDVHAAGTDVAQAGAQVRHQALAVEARPDPVLDGWARLLVQRALLGDCVTSKAVRVERDNGLT